MPGNAGTLHLSCPTLLLGSGWAGKGFADSLGGICVPKYTCLVPVEIL